MQESKHVAAWVALSLALGARSTRLKPLLAHFGTPDRIFAATKAELSTACPTLGAGALAALQYQKYEREVTRILEYCHRRGVQLLTPDTEGYPASLLAIAEPPAVLYCLGNIPRSGTRPFVGVVGARRADAYGERMAYKLSFELAAAGAVVVSGLAEGVDGVAAAAAIDAGTPTVAVLGCGIDRVYPKHHTRLFSEVAELGAVVTEYAPGTPPNGWNFPARNRIISALSEAVVVVEADERSGALITARYALLQGKSLFAIPGDADNPRAVGCNKLLRAGAMVALGAEDVLSHFRFLYRDTLDMHVPEEALQYAGVTPEKLRAHGLHAAKEEKPAAQAAAKRPRRTRAGKDAPAPEVEGQVAMAPVADKGEVLHSLSDREKEIYQKLPDEPFTVDLLVGMGIPAREAVAAMTLFEILALVTSKPGGTYQRSL